MLLRRRRVPHPLGVHVDPPCPRAYLMLSGCTTKRRYPCGGCRSLPCLVSCLTVGAAATASAATTLKLTLKETSSKETGNGFIARDDIFQNGAKVGTGPAVCRYVFPSGSDNPTGASCKATLTLAGGNADHGRVRVPIGQRPREGHWRDGQISGRDRNRRTAAEANNTTASTLHLDDGAPVERDGGFSYASGDVAGSPGGGSPCSRSTTRIGPRVSR
jgi:hypothetical protein